MNRLQKIAWFNLIAIITGFALIVLCAVCEVPKNIMTIVLTLEAAALIAGPPIFFRKKPGQVAFDERDAMIREKSLIVGFGGAYGFLGALYVAKLFEVGFNGSVPMLTVFLAYIMSLVCFVWVKSFIVLSMYGWRGRDGGE